MDIEQSGRIELETKVKDLLYKDQMVEAMKLVMDELKLGLKSSKDYIDEIKQRLHLKS